MKIKILIPVYNDWESLTKLLEEINEVVKSINNVEFNCIVVNDSSTSEAPKFKVRARRSQRSTGTKRSTGHK